MKSISILFLILLTTFQTHAQNSIKLYQGKAPGSETWTWGEKVITPSPGNRILYDVSVPEIFHFPAAKEKSNAKELGIDPHKIGFMGFSAGGTVTMSVALSASE